MPEMCGLFMYAIYTAYSIHVKKNRYPYFAVFDHEYSEMFTTEILSTVSYVPTIYHTCPFTIHVAHISLIPRFYSPPV